MMNPCAVRIATLALLFALGLLAGCPRTDPAVLLVSLRAGNQKPQFDARLLGTWRTVAHPGDRWPPATIEVRAIERAGVRGYGVVAPWYFEHPVEGWLHMLDGTHAIVELQLPPGGAEPRELIRPLHLVRVRIEGDRLEVALLSMQLGEWLDRGGGNLPAVSAPGLWVLTERAEASVRAAAERVQPRWVIEFER